MLPTPSLAMDALSSPAGSIVDLLDGSEDQGEGNESFQQPQPPPPPPPPPFGNGQSLGSGTPPAGGFGMEDNPLAQFLRYTAGTVPGGGNQTGEVVIGTRRPRSPNLHDDDLVGRIARRRRLNPDALQDLQSFSQELLVPQLVLMFGLLLEILEYVAAQNAPAKYEIPEDLKKTLKTYATATVLSPRLSAYLKGNVDCIISSLRLRGNTLIPDASDTARIDVVKSYLTGVLTDKRCKLKAAIVETVKSATEQPAAADQDGPAAGAAKGKRKKVVVYQKKDVGVLCSAILKKMSSSKSSTTVRITLAMYHRIAFLRRCVNKFGAEEDFWNRVDDRLATVRRVHKTQADQDKYYKGCFSDDVKEHGDPKRGSYVLESSLEAWQVTIQNESERAALSAADHQAAGAQAASGSAT